MEPLLDSGQELQAIGRVHRFGQVRARVLPEFSVVVVVVVVVVLVFFVLSSSVWSLA